MNVLARSFMIKTSKCKECDRNAFSKGLCQIHQPKKSIKQSRESSQNTKLEKQDKRNNYFEYHLERCVRSSESFKQIIEPTRANICHLIDKGRHESLQDNVENCIYLTWEEHTRFDELLFSHRFEDIEKEFKNSWPKTCISYKKLLPLCEENTVFTRALEKYLNGKRIKS